MTKGNLLLIDDEVLLLKGLKMHLTDLADNIFIAENGVQGLEVLAKEKVHCILCDINMPKMNGIEVIKNLRAQNVDIPFIFYTGHGNHELMLEAVKYGAFDFLSKPGMDGMEEVIQRGLKKGLGVGETPDKADFMSEYQQLLNSLKETRKI
jgi:YesN/AraC family two-component response regulator